MDKTCNIVAQYIQSLYATALVRPYENKLALSNAITVGLTIEQLPHPGHHRIELTVDVVGTNTDGVLCFETGASIEGIAVEANLTEEERTHMLEQRLPALLLGSLRAAISSASLATGYGPVTLPPMTGEQLLSLARTPKSE